MNENPYYHEIKIIFENGDYEFTKIYRLTQDEVREYYIGKIFNIGITEDDLQKCVDVEFLSPYSLNDYLEKTIVEITTSDGGERFIHYYAYGYYTDVTEEPPYRFLEYTWFVAPLKEALSIGLYEYKSEYQDQYKQYIEDCTKDICQHHYEHYDNGKMPKLIASEEVDMDTPDGTYILM